MKFINTKNSKCTNQQFYNCTQLTHRNVYSPKLICFKTLVSIMVQVKQN